MEFNRGAIQPVECFRESWALVKPRYGLMLGITLVGVIIGSMGPFGLLLGPMMCGIFLCYLKVLRGEEIEFNTLFKGFEFFMPGFIVALVQVIPLMFIQIPYIGWMMYLTMTNALSAPRGRAANPMDIYTPTFFISMGADIVLVTFVSVILQGFFVFGYGLVVDREMNGLDAVKLSARAAMANIGGILGIVGINILLGLTGSLLCFVGGIFLIPITMGVWVVAYRKVFPEASSVSTTFGAR
ncbi:MAG: hypothetical protein ABIP75_05325 [Pyrinomonadaceae bacterium]